MQPATWNPCAFRNLKVGEGGRQGSHLQPIDLPRGVKSNSTAADGADVPLSPQRRVPNGACCCRSYAATTQQRRGWSTVTCWCQRGFVKLPHLDARLDGGRCTCKQRHTVLSTGRSVERIGRCVSGFRRFPFATQAYRILLKHEADTTTRHPVLGCGGCSSPIIQALAAIRRAIFTAALSERWSPRARTNYTIRERQS